VLKLESQLNKKKLWWTAPGPGGKNIEPLQATLLQ